MGRIKNSLFKVVLTQVLLVFVMLGLTQCSNDLLDTVETVTDQHTANTTIPPAPGKPLVEAGVTRLTVTWNAVLGAQSYEVFWSTYDNTASIPVSNIKPTTLTEIYIDNLSNGTRYYIWVRAKNSVGTGEFSAMSFGIPVWSVQVTGVSFNSPTTSIIRTNKQRLQPIFTPENPTNKNVSWSSSNPDVATVTADGTVTAVNIGAAVITVTTEDGGKKATCTVTVQTDIVSVTGISVNQPAMTIRMGASGHLYSEQLVHTIDPSNATDQNILWTSSNPSVATVNPSGLVTAVAPGTANITVTANDGGLSAVCGVTVIQLVTGVTLDRSSLTLDFGVPVRLTATALPLNAGNRTVTWTSSPSGVVYVDSSGSVSALTVGSAVVTASASDGGGESASCSVAVNGLVTFDKNDSGATGYTEPKKIASGTAAALSMNGFTKPNFFFDGWATSPNGPVEYADGVSFTMGTSNVTLYAKWVVREYSVTFVANGGSGTMTAQPIAWDSTAALRLNAFIRAGYSFAGWNTLANGSGTTYANGAPYHMTGSNISLYAMWTANTYSLSFDGEGGSTPTAQNATYASTYGPLPASTRSGYDFDGWWTGASGTGTQITSGTTVSITAPQTLYAKWNLVTYSITYSLGGGTNNAGNPPDYTVLSSLITLLDPTRIGYIFSGWSPISEIPAGSTGPVAVTAGWTANNYTISFDGEGGSTPASQNVTYASVYGPLPASTRSGYNFDGWWTEASGMGTEITAASVVTITANQTLYANWTPTVYPITYVLGTGGVNNAGNPSFYSIASPLITLAAPSRPGYSFVSWSPSSSISAGSTGSRTFTALWTANTYIISFNGGGGSTPSVQNAIHGSIYGPLPTSTRNGYDFDGWWTGTLGTGTEITEAAVVTVTANQTLYAKWNPIAYSIAYILDGGVNNVGNPSAYTIESSLITLAAPTRTGYTGTWNPSSTILAGSTGSRTFTAVWTANSYIVSFNAGGGSTPTAQNVTYGSLYGPLPVSSRSGYVFDGWWTGESGTGTHITADSTVTITEPQILYSKWLSMNADLGNLHFDFVTSTQDFPTPSSALSVYVANIATSVTVTGITVRTGTGIVYSPAQTLSLSVGINTMTVTVTAEDSVTTRTYTVTITRAEP